MVGRDTFRVDARYSGLKQIGKGSFGVVCSALDNTQNKRVAIKKIHPMASHVVHAKYALREIRMMRYLGVHPNIVSLEDVFVREDHDELYIVMELLDTDLRHVIQSPQPLGDGHHRYIMYQLLRGVKFLHDNGIIHRDLKPGNILVTKNCQLRIADFGLARLRSMGRGADPDDEVNPPMRPMTRKADHHDEVGHPMTEHVVTRWYRPPELMLYPDGLYGNAVDLWSVGCIFAELLSRKPLFPGKTFIHQLSLIFNVLGSPEPGEVSHIRNLKAKKFLDSKRDRIKVPFREVLQSASEEAVDLVEGLLVFDPPKRFSAQEALEHRYFSPLRRADTSPRLEVPSAFEFDFERKPLCKSQLKELILEEVNSFKMRNPEYQGRRDVCGGVKRLGRKRWAKKEFLPVQDACYTEDSQHVSNGGEFDHRPWTILRGQARGEGCEGKDGVHARGRRHHGAAGPYHVPHPVRDKQFQGQQQRLLQQQQHKPLMQLQGKQHSGKKAARVYDVEERFYMLKVERARLGLPVT